MSENGDEPDADARIEPVPANAAAAAAAEPPPRPSGSLSLGGPLTFPDDGVVSTWVRKIDHALGIVEQALLFGTLAIVVLTASTHAILEKVTGEGLWWSFDVIRGGTFTVALLGAAFATYQSRHLAMDLISRRLPPRGRLVLAIVLSLFTMLIAGVLMRSGLHQVEQITNDTGEHLFEKREVVKLLPIGCVLIIIHAFLHLLIDADYLIRNKLPPERARSGH